ncbi:hypothetical protein GUJ93_ZPchr0010g7236 [Zizania palustris]|uniref:Uncharacterized protein n=1 Tax=Zizania palustris TaxID=103762 RepID=A0A8J6BN90_ZIZPA|nr:hypothetical protein GUJ93_ZPchr0010g7236 [Zizania palustris]
MGRARDDPPRSAAPWCPQKPEEPRRGGTPASGETQTFGALSLVWEPPDLLPAAGRLVTIAAMGMKFRVVCRKLYDYEVTRLYGASWVRDIGPELRPNDYKKAKVESDINKEESDINTEEGRREPTTIEDLVAALKGGAEDAKPVLRRIYMARASNYTDALKNYVESYKEGLKEHLEKEALDKGNQQGNKPTKPPQSPSS